MQIELSHLESPLGEITFAVSEGALLALDFAERAESIRSRLERCYPDVRPRSSARVEVISARIEAYFSGELRALDDIRTETRGTEFQKRVWAALRTVPVGETSSYRALATAIGKPSAVRAVGSANAQNPITLVVPCHRIIASDGSLCGYANGLWRKEWLLRHERAVLV